jgi:hypothetical protein
MLNVLGTDLFARNCARLFTLFGAKIRDFFRNNLAKEKRKNFARHLRMNFSEIFYAIVVWVNVCWRTDHLLIAILKDLAQVYLSPALAITTFTGNIL